MVVKVLGTGCKKCTTLQEKVQTIINQNNIEATVEKVTDINDIMNYGIMMTPGLVIDEKVVCVGTIPKDEQILTWLKG